MNSPDKTMPEASKSMRRICPFLGMLEDPETSLAFPADVNSCYASEPPAVPKIDYQASHCLALTYLSCPVYSAKEKAPLPPEIRLKTNGGGARIKLQAPWLVRTIGAFIIATLIFFIGWFGVAGLNRSMNVREAARTQPTLPVLLTSTRSHPLATQTPRPTSTNPAFTETSTPALMDTLNPQPPQTNCGRPAGWVQYVIRSGDTLSQLSQAFRVTVAQLQSANCMGASTVLHVGQMFYVPSGAVNPVYPTSESTWPVSTFAPTDTLSTEWTVTPEAPTEAPTSYPTIIIPSQTPSE